MHVWPNKLAEFLGADFTQSLKSSDLHSLSQLLHGRITFSFRVAVASVLFVPHSKQRRFQNENAAIHHQLLEKAQEKGEHQVADVKAVVVRISGNDNLAVSQPGNIVFNAQSRHQVEQLLVAINLRPPLAKHIQGLSPQTKNCLSHGIAAAHHGARSRVSLGNKNHGVVTLGISQVVLAILELGNVQGDFLGRLLGFFFHRIQFRAKPLVGSNLLLQSLC